MAKIRPAMLQKAAKDIYQDRCVYSYTKPRTQRCVIQWISSTEKPSRNFQHLPPKHAIEPERTISVTHVS